jgi:hypothetical protein
MSDFELKDPIPTPQERINKLCRIIGPAMTKEAIDSEAHNIKRVILWQDGEVPPPEVRARLELLDVTVESLIDDGNSPSAIRALLRDPNRELDDRAILTIIAHEPVEIAGPLLLNAIDRLA